MVTWDEASARTHEARVAAGRGKKASQPLSAATPAGAELLRRSAAKVLAADKQPSTDEAKLNKTEKRYLALLRARGLSPEVQAVKLKLANMCTYTADFSCECNMEKFGGDCSQGDGHNFRFTLFEVKGGYTREDAWIKLKMAARQFRSFRFVLAKWDGGKWDERVVPP